MSNIKFSELSNSDGFTAGDSLIGIHDAGEGAFVNYKYSSDIIINEFKKGFRIIETITEEGSSFYSQWAEDKTVQVLITIRGALFRDIGFTQDGGTITARDAEFTRDENVLLLT